MKVKELSKKIIILSLMLTFLVSITGCSQTTIAPSTNKISTQVVKKGNLQVGLYADGRITLPITRANFDVSGSVKSILVHQGQSVQAGDLMAILDDAVLQQAVIESQRDLKKAQATYSDAVSTQDYTIRSEKIKLDSLYAKYNTLFDASGYEEDISDALSKVAEKQFNLDAAKTANNQLFTAGALPDALSNAEKAITAAEAALLSAQEAQDKAEDVLANAIARFNADKLTLGENYELQKLKYDNLARSTAAVSNAEYSLELAQDKLKKANDNLGKVNLYAPITGKVINISYSVGDMFVTRSTTESSTSTAAVTSFITLYDPSEIYLNAFINEGDISGLIIGQTLRVTVDALGLENLTGQVSAISALPKIDNTGIVTYAVNGKLDKPNESILDGMNTFILFLKKEKPNVLLVSNKAIFMVEGKQYVMVMLADGTTEKREVACGLSNGTQSEVIEGLLEGETVIIGGVKT